MLSGFTKKNSRYKGIARLFVWYPDLHSFFSALSYYYNSMAYQNQD
jgi:hypothetical protein